MNVVMVKTIGILLIGCGLYVWFSIILDFLRCNEKTTATLVSIDVRREMDSTRVWRNYYVPVYSYEVDGKIYTNPGKEYKLDPAWYDINSTCEVRYNPSNPNDFIAKKRTGKMVIGFIIVVFGLLFLYMGRYKG